MVGFDNTINNILNSLGGSVSIDVIPVESSTNQRFDEFKQWVVGYVQEHDNLEHNHPVLQQLSNFNSADEIEQILVQSLDYCDDCLLNMYRKFAAGEVSEDACPCGGEDSEEGSPSIEAPPGGG